MAITAIVFPDGDGQDLVMYMTSAPTNPVLSIEYAPITGENAPEVIQLYKAAPTGGGGNTYARNRVVNT